jgi:hypothetical protein
MVSASIALLGASLAGARVRPGHGLDRVGASADAPRPDYPCCVAIEFHADQIV